MKAFSLTHRRNSNSIGFVPTMGALHEGHLSLIDIARKHCGCAVASIFVNPAQFGPNEDFAKYPRAFERDCGLLEAAGCDCVFAPAVGDMYPDNYGTYVNVDGITDTLCGASRPGHFRGVATVVLKLFNIVLPDAAVFGSKDAQQVAVIRRMVEDLNLSVRIIAAPIAREAGGLAMSSRNAYLTIGERREAAAIYAGLAKSVEMYNDGCRDSQQIKNCVLTEINRSSTIKPEYVEAVDTKSLQPVDKIDGQVLIAVACRTSESGTRLIDNVVLKDKNL
jgi:pantoate--beta-alanine ligase